MKKLTLPLFTLLLLLTGAACKHRQVIADDGHTPKGTGAEVLEAYSKTCLRFDHLSLKGKGTFSNPTDKSNFTFTYRINIQRDSLIWASISKFGFEGMRILASKDSVWIRRMDVQEGTRCDFGYIAKAVGMDVDFASVQSFLLGEVVGSPASLQFVEGSKNPYQFLGSLGNYEVKWFLDGRSSKVTRAEGRETNTANSSNFAWSDFRIAGDQLLAHLTTVDVVAPKPMHIEMNHTAVELDGEAPNFNFSFPDNYTIKNCDEK